MFSEQECVDAVIVASIPCPQAFSIDPLAARVDPRCLPRFTRIQTTPSPSQRHHQRHHRIPPYSVKHDGSLSKKKKGDLIYIVFLSLIVSATVQALRATASVPNSCCCEHELTITFFQTLDSTKTRGFIEYLEGQRYPPRQKRQRQHCLASESAKNEHPPTFAAPSSSCLLCLRICDIERNGLGQSSTSTPAPWHQSSDDPWRVPKSFRPPAGKL